MSNLVGGNVVPPPMCEKKLLEQVDEGLNVPLAPSQTFTSICSSM